MKMVGKRIDDSVVDETISLKKIQVAGWVYLLILTVGSWMIVSWSFAWAVLAGGIISIVSFMMSHRDVGGFIETLAATRNVENDNDTKKVKKSKTGFILKFWFRIGVIGVVLFLLIRSGETNVFGLILGLSTVVFTITFMAVSVARRYFFSGRR
ncbi:MAG: ATP synthase subunit I [Desulfopila sp.]|jgi:hypothetical protein|nr:ATP synthase subunit I [Desulfopila sp.]